MDFLDWINGLRDRVARGMFVPGAYLEGGTMRTKTHYDPGGHSEGDCLRGTVGHVVRPVYRPNQRTYGEVDVAVPLGGARGRAVLRAKLPPRIGMSCMKGQTATIQLKQWGFGPAWVVTGLAVPHEALLLMNQRYPDPSVNCRCVVTQVQKEEPMDNKKTLVHFTLPSRYFTGSRSPGNNGMSRETCQRVLRDAFSLPIMTWHDIMARNSNGFDIVCRPDQFARFIVARFEADECINGIKDLNPHYVAPRDAYDDIADRVGLDRAKVIDVLKAVEHVPTAGKVRVPASEARSLCGAETVDVSRSYQ